MDIKLKTPRHIHEPVDTLSVDSVMIDFASKTIRYSAHAAPGAARAMPISRVIKIEDDGPNAGVLAAIVKLVEEDAAKIGE